MKRIYWVCIFTCLAGGVFAQDLDTVTITDQFNSGDRGNNQGTYVDPEGDPTFGASKTDGTDFADYSGPDLTASVTTSVRYINSWGTDGSVESPVLTVTSPMANPDRAQTIPAIPANNRPGATGGSTALIIGDDGGFNAIFFGESNDSDYYVQADVYCWNKAGGPGLEFAGIVARAGRDNDPFLNEFTYNPDRAGSYSVFYDYQLQEVKAVEWKTSNTVGLITARDPNSYVQHGSSITGVAEGWHTMKIECKDSRIEFSFDGTVIANVVSTSFTFGRPGLYYRETLVPSADERQGIFDQLKAGPATLISGVADWSVY